MNNTNKRFLLAVLIALFIKLCLFSFAELNAPQAKFQVDSEIYMQTAHNLATHRAFTTKYNDDGTYYVELLRTPGYPLFLAFFNKIMRIPYSGVIIIQIFLTVLTALITYKAATYINPKLAFLSAIIVLYDPPVTIFSLMLLTETLFLFLIAVFMYLFTLYLKDKKLQYLLMAALILATATYVRPIAYFLGLAVGMFMIYVSFRKKAKRMIVHLLVFLVTVYSLIGLWHLRNYHFAKINTFSHITALAASYRKHVNNDSAITKSLSPVPYYLNAVSRCFVNLMTRPGTLKNFNSPLLKDVGKIFGYPWVVFWLIGFLVGISKVERNFCLQFMAYIALYFICASIAGILFGVSSRQRVPMVPFIAILSAHGWIWIAAAIKTRRKIAKTCA